MSNRLIVAGAVALLAAAGAGVWLLDRQLPPVGGEELAALPGDGLVTFARIQTEMNRAAAGRPALADDANADPLEDVAKALREYLAGNTVKASTMLDGVEAEIDARVPTDDQVAADPLLADKEEWLVSYFELLPDPPSGKGIKADTYVFNRLAVTLRRVDAVLLAETLPSLKDYDLVARHAAGEPSVFEGQALRLPCRLAGSHRAAVGEALRMMGPLAAGLTDCPVAKGRETDSAALAAVSANPALAVSAPAEASVPAPRDLKTRLMTAAAKGKSADIAREAQAPGADPQRADARGRRAYHYLSGNGELSASEREQAARQLF